MLSARIFTNEFNRIISATKGFCAPTSTFKGSNDFSCFIKLEFDAENSTVTAVAVDGYRISVEHAIISNCETSFVGYIRPSVKLPNSEYATITLEDNEIVIRCKEFMCGYKQPEIKTVFDWRKAIPVDTPSFRIGFNPNYLLSALQAAKASVGNAFKNPVVLEFRSALNPVILRTGNEDIKLVQPVWLKGE